jgi:hypothetical protein
MSSIFYPPPPATAAALSQGFYKPCLNRSANCFFPNSHAFSSPFSLRSMPLTWTSCCGGRDTRCTIAVGSVSKITPSSTISSIASATKS